MGKQAIVTALTGVALLLVAIGLLSGSVMVESMAQPAAHSRAYVVDAQRPDVPAKIVIAAPEDAAVIIRDPTLHVMTTKANAKQRASAVAASIPIRPQARHQFKTRTIVGRLSQPRASFEKERLELDRVEPRRELDFFRRLAESRPPEL